MIDNVASLMCLIRGRSHNAELEEICHVIHVVLFALKAFVYWECITSVANWAINWADPISRKGLKELRHQRRNFATFPSYFDYRLLKLTAVIRVVQFL